MPDELLALYEKQRARYGVGASHLRAGVSTASGVMLNATDLGVVRAAAPDDVLLCPESSAIDQPSPSPSLWSSSWKRVRATPSGPLSRALSERHGVSVGGATSSAPPATAASVASRASATSSATLVRLLHGQPERVAVERERGVDVVALEHEPQLQCAHLRLFCMRTVPSQRSNL